MTDAPETATTPAPAGETPGLFAFADCELVGINNGMMLVINRQNGNQQIMSPQVVEGLKTCTTFGTIAEHAAHLANTRPELRGQQSMAATALEGLRSDGMLLQAQDICTRWAQTTPTRLAPTRVFIVTCDRPAAVERLLESMLATGNLSQHNALFLVDDSREQANRQANNEAVARFNLRSAKDMFYVGAEAQAALLAGLVGELPEHAAGIRFLLDGSLWAGRKTYGRSRTLSLLLSVGYRAILLDDDILCRAVLPPVRESGFGIGSGGMRKAAFFTSEQELLQSAPPAGFDPLSGHASLLGSTLGHALDQFNNGPLAESQLHHVNGALASALQADSPVLVTQCGSLGDPGTGGAHWAQYLGVDSIQRLVSAPQGMAAALESGLSWLGSSRPNIFKMPFMSQATGLDNSHLLPPYFPAFRGEDALFGAMLVAMHHHSVSIEYPWSVPHLPMESRRFSVEAPIAGNGGISLFARYLTAHIDYKDTTDPEHHLRFLAQDALRLAARSDADLLLDFRTELARGHADQLYLLQDQFARARNIPSPDWQAYLQRGIEEVQVAIATIHSPAAITGVPQNSTDTALLAEFRGMARGFSAAMSGWVETRKVAARLVEELVASRSLLPR